MIDIIYHTASTKKDYDNFHKLLNEDINTIELDFVLTKDLVPIWSHNKKVKMISINSINSNDELLRKYLTLSDIFDITNHKKELLLDFKYIDKKILDNSSFDKILDYITSQDNCMIQSVNKDLIKYLIEKNGYNSIRKGLIINYFSSYYYNQNNIGSLENVDFISLASELWEIKRGNFLNNCNYFFPNAKKYAWVWDVLYKETPKKLSNFIEKGADGIITNKPEEVKRLIKEKQKLII